MVENGQKVQTSSCPGCVMYRMLTMVSNTKKKKKKENELIQGNN